MPSILSKLASSAFLVCALASSQCLAQTPAPDSMADFIKMMHLDKATNITYRDAAGKPVTSEEMWRLHKEGRSISVSKKGPSGPAQEVVIAVISKDAAAALTAPAYKLKAGDAFPDFRFARLDGTAIDNKALQGRYSLVNFYFAECAPCINEVPELNALANSRSGMNFVAVTFDSAADTRKFFADTGFNWPLVPEAQKLATEVGVKSYPTFALLDPQGKVVAIARHDEIHGKGGTVEAWVDKLVAPAAQ